MKIYRKCCIQYLPVSIEQAWIFLSDPKNLQVITPAHMGFRMLSSEDRAMYPGQIISYSITPLFGVRIGWITEITHVIDKSYFVDEQRFGPYALWHHKHFIRAVPGGVEMEDIIDYKLPFGIIGPLLHRFFVRNKLDEIFEYRKHKLIELFGS